MADIGLIQYDKPRKWIRECRANNATWDEIEYGRKSNHSGLQIFLEMQTDINFWPDMTISDWKQLVQSERNAEENVKRIDII